MSSGRRPELAGLEIADPPERWAELGFDVVDGYVDLGGVRVRLGASGQGIVSWTLRGVGSTEIDGLATCADSGGPPPGGPVHANGAIGIDHVVVVTPDFDRTSAIPRRVRS